MPCIDVYRWYIYVHSVPFLEDLSQVDTSNKHNNNIKVVYVFTRGVFVQ